MNALLIVFAVGAGTVAASGVFFWLAPYLLRWQLRRMERIMGKTE